MESADEETVTRVLQVLKDRARVLPHENRVRRVVVNPELIADAVLLADTMQRNPGSRRVGDVVVKIIARRPPWHRARLDSIDQASRLGLGQERHEVLFEVAEVLVHACD